MLRRIAEHFAHHEYNQSVLATLRFLITKIEFAREKANKQGMVFPSWPCTGTAFKTVIRFDHADCLYLNALLHHRQV